MASVFDNETVQRRLKYVLEVKHGDKSIRQAAEDAGVDWKTMKRWIVRFDVEGIEGLRNKPRGRAKAVDTHTKERIKDLKTENRARSTRKVRDLMNERYNIKVHRQTVWRVLKEAGENKREKVDLKVYRDFERHHPNDLWQIDYMDAIVVEGVGLVYLILIIDDHSRKIIAGEFVPDRTAFRALALLWQAVKKYGIPSQIYSDRGKQFISHIGKGYTHFEKVCKRLGIEPIFGTPGYPEGRGKIERLFGFIQADFLSEYHFKSTIDMNLRFEGWINWYNEKHEHSSLGGLPPNSRYKNVIQRKPEGDLFEIFSEHFTRKVRTNATISFKGKIYPVTPEHIKKKVDVRVFGNDIRLYYESQLLGEYDDRIDYHEKMLRQVYTRVVRKNGTIKFRNVRYSIGMEYAGKKVELYIIRDQLRAFLHSNRMLIFKLGESDAVIVNLTREL